MEARNYLKRLSIAMSMLVLFYAPALSSCKVKSFSVNNPLFSCGVCQAPLLASTGIDTGISFKVRERGEFFVSVAKLLVRSVGSFKIQFEPSIGEEQFERWNELFWGSDRDIKRVGWVSKYFPWSLWSSMTAVYWLDSSGAVTEAVYSVSYRCSSKEKERAAVTSARIVKGVAKSIYNVLGRERAIHDWIAKNVTYDLESLGGYDQTDCKALFEGMAVCNGYSVLAARMLNMAGIRTLFVAGEAYSIPHAWNMVKLGDDWFHLDVTFDDPLCGEGTCGPLYNYFNLSDEEIAFDHDWDRSLYPSADKTFSEALYSGIVVHTCSIFEPELCRSELDCLRISGTWKDGVCYPPGEEEVTSCDSEHRFLCRDEESCERVGSAWYNNTCMIPDTAEYFCESSGGYWFGGECHEETSACMALEPNDSENQATFISDTCLGRFDKAPDKEVFYFIVTKAPGRIRIAHLPQKRGRICGNTYRLYLKDSEGEVLSVMTVTYSDVTNRVEKEMTVGITKPGVYYIEFRTGEILDCWDQNSYYRLSIEPEGGLEIANEPCSPTSLDACYNENLCEEAGGYWYDGACHDEPEPASQSKHVPDKKDVGLYKGNESSAPVARIDGRVNVSFSYEGSVDILVGVISCDFKTVWWLHDDCQFHEGYDEALAQGTSLSCSNVQLPTDAGYIFWLVSGTPISQLDWAHGAYELKFYSFGECK